MLDVVYIKNFCHPPSFYNEENTCAETSLNYTCFPFLSCGCFALIHPGLHPGKSSALCGASKLATHALLVGFVPLQSYCTTEVTQRKMVTFNWQSECNHNWKIRVEKAQASNHKGEKSNWQPFEKHQTQRRVRTVVVQELLNEVDMSHKHPPAAVANQTQCIQSITASNRQKQGPITHHQLDAKLFQVSHITHSSG